MFATIAGTFPPVPGGSLRRRLRPQVESGLGMVCDGRIHGAEETPTAVVEAWRRADALARELTEPGVEPPLVKACLVGPYSHGLGRGGAGAMTRGRRRRTLARAEAVAEVVARLFEAGAAVVQVQEDGLVRVGADDRERTLARQALEVVSRDAGGHLSLAVCGGDADAAGAPLFFDLPFASYLFDLILGPDNWRLIAQAPHDRGVICGVADARTRTRDDEVVMIWAARYAASLRGRGPERVGLAPSAGLEALPVDVATAKLAALAEAARKAALPDDELVSQLDPRAIDARSAALGRLKRRRAAAPCAAAEADRA